MFLDTQKTAHEGMVGETTDRRRGREFAVRKMGWYLARFAGHQEARIHSSQCAWAVPRLSHHVLGSDRVLSKGVLGTSKITMSSAHREV